MVAVVAAAWLTAAAILALNIYLNSDEDAIYDCDFEQFFFKISKLSPIWVRVKEKKGRRTELG